MYHMGNFKYVQNKQLLDVLSMFMLQYYYQGVYALCDYICDTVAIVYIHTVVSIKIRVILS